MEYREVFAPNIEEAKYKIKKEFGDTARIIKVMDVSKGGFLGFGGKKQVKLLISIPDIDLLKKYRENMGINKIVEKKFEKIKNDKEDDLLNDGITPMTLVMEKLNQIENQIQKNLNDEDMSLHLNILEVKQILKENEFFDDFIDKLILSIKDNLSYTQLESRVEVHKYAYEYVKEQLLVSDDAGIKNKEKKVLVLVGPTGVGKTTTVAKIAANAIKEKLTVELITIDGYRIGAKYQLEKYAEYMRTPVSGVEDNMELQKVVDLSDADLILVDTIGRSAQDEMNLVKMKQLLKFNRVKPEFLLTVSASTKVSEVKRIFKNFDIFDYKSIIITKLDESETIGGILNSAIDYNRSIKYFTNGQRVPNDIGKATLPNLMDRVKGLEMEVYLNNV